MEEKPSLKVDLDLAKQVRVDNVLEIRAKKERRERIQKQFNKPNKEMYIIERD